MKQRKLIVRIIALLMALLMGLGIFGFIFQIIGSAADATTIAAIATTGSEAAETRWPIYAAAGAVLVIIVCVVVPMITKKK